MLFEGRVGCVRYKSCDCLEASLNVLGQVESKRQLEHIVPSLKMAVKNAIANQRDIDTALTMKEVPDGSFSVESLNKLLLTPARACQKLLCEKDSAKAALKHVGE